MAHQWLQPTRCAGARGRLMHTVGRGPLLLVANCVIFYNVFAMSQVWHELEAEGEAVDDAALAALSPYLTAHINRLDRYDIDPTRRPPALDYTRFAPPVPPRKQRESLLAVAQPLHYVLWR